jgi:hypothetical protein
LRAGVGPRSANEEEVVLGAIVRRRLEPGEIIEKGEYDIDDGAIFRLCVLVVVVKWISE